MIRLDKRLPDSILVDGNHFFLNTNFRAWLKFPQVIENMDIDGYISLFQDDVPDMSHDVLTQLAEFYHTPAEIPRQTKKSGSDVDLLDYDYDSDYVYAAFWQAYGINLSAADLHWHEYHALLVGLPSDTLLVKIMGWRGYDGNRSDVDHKQQVELQRIWSLPRKRTAEEERLNDEFESHFA